MRQKLRRSPEAEMLPRQLRDAVANDVDKRVRLTREGLTRRLCEAVGQESAVPSSGSGCRRDRS